MKPSDPLRHFSDADDLFSSVDEGEIVKWVNQLFELKEAQRFSGKKYRTKLRMFEQIASKLLSPDEIERVRQAAEEAVNEVDYNALRQEKETE